MTNDEGSHELQAYVDAHLMVRGVTPRQGLAGPICQTGEEYVEITVAAQDFDVLKNSVTGAVSIFSVAGDTCYWRIRPEYEGFPEHGLNHKAYARFCITNKSEPVQEKPDRNPFLAKRTQ